MSWAEAALGRGAVQAGRLPVGPIREGALRGLEVLSEPDVINALDRRGADAVAGLAAGLFGDDLTSSRLVFTSTKSGLAGIGEELDTINADRQAALEEERQVREDWAAIMGAIGKAGMVAVKLGLGMVLAGGVF